MHACDSWIGSASHKTGALFGIKLQVLRHTEPEGDFRGMCDVLQMPPIEEVKTSEYLRQLTVQTHSREFWEVGASCNFLIAAARMGLNTAAVANLGEDVYGQFLLDVLKVLQCPHLLCNCSLPLAAPQNTLIMHLEYSCPSFSSMDELVKKRP